MKIVRFLSILCIILVTQNLWAPPKMLTSCAAERAAESAGAAAQPALESYPLCYFAPNIEDHIIALLKREQGSIWAAQ